MAIDYAALLEDPCAAVAALKPLLLEQIVEGQVRRIEFNNREIEFHPNDIKNLRNLIAELEDECAANLGTARKRRKFAISGRF